MRVETITVTVTEAEAGQTVQRILRGKLRFSARAVSRLKWTETGILVNGARAFTNRVLRAGDVLCVEAGDHRPPRVEIVAGDWPLRVVWEDEWLLVVDKPAGMTAHASNFDPDAPTVAGALAYQRGGGFLFHPVSRLDRGTTGLMAVAKSGYVHDLLRRALHTDGYCREYLALCEGKPERLAGVIDAPIGRDTRSLIARRVCADGAPAVTGYEVICIGRLTSAVRVSSFTGGEEGNGEISLIRARPRTGRTHQIRVHMASISCPLLGDWLYGRESPELIGRPALHSCRLGLTHPVTGARLELEAPLPADMARLVRALRGDTGSAP